MKIWLYSLAISHWILIPWLRNLILNLSDHVNVPNSESTRNLVSIFVSDSLSANWPHNVCLAVLCWTSSEISNEFVQTYEKYLICNCRRYWNEILLVWKLFHTCSTFGPEMLSQSATWIAEIQVDGAGKLDITAFVCFFGQEEDAVKHKYYCNEDEF